MTKKTKIKTIEIYRAIKTVLSINYRYRLLDVYISPLRVEFLFAVRFLNDPKMTWHPRVITFFPNARRVSIMQVLKDHNPTWIDAATILAMAEQKTVF